MGSKWKKCLIEFRPQYVFKIKTRNFYVSEVGSSSRLGTLLPVSICSWEPILHSNRGDQSIYTQRQDFSGLDKLTLQPRPEGPRSLLHHLSASGKPHTVQLDSPVTSHQTMDREKLGHNKEFAVCRLYSESTSQDGNSLEPILQHAVDLPF